MGNFLEIHCCSQASIIENYRKSKLKDEIFGNLIYSPFELPSELPKSNGKIKETPNKENTKKIEVSEKETPNSKEFDLSIEKTDTKTSSINEKEKTVCIEDFKFVKLLGRGTFGKVILVEHKNSEKLFAMKVMKKAQIEEMNQKEHAQNEKLILEKYTFPFLIDLHYSFQSKEKLYFVMDFLQGGELFFHLKRAKKFSENKIRFYAAEILLAIEYLHQNNVIYRDLKPENVLLDSEGHVKITDFGLSKYGVEVDEKTYTFCGTAEYIAPEILLGEGHTKAVDWWSFGAVIYEMASGSPPFYHTDREKMFQNILTKPIIMKNNFSKNLCSLLKGLLTIDPKNRLGSSPEDSLEIKNHPFFKKVNWNDILLKKIIPPLVPIVNNLTDTRYFEDIFTEELLIDTPLIKRYDNTYEEYENFTFIAEENSENSSPSSNFSKLHRVKSLEKLSKDYQNSDISEELNSLEVIKI